MLEEMLKRIDAQVRRPPAPGARLPRWTAAALLTAGLALPATGCWRTEGPAEVYAGPPVREPEVQPQPPPDEPEGKKGDGAAPAEPSMGIETVPIYGIRR